MSHASMREAATEAAAIILRQLDDLEVLGAFAGQDVEKQKTRFLILCLENFAKDHGVLT